MLNVAILFKSGMNLAELIINLKGKLCLKWPNVNSFCRDMVVDRNPNVAKSRTG
jgi:hypothetical protein